MELIEYISNSKKPILLDGGMGTQLDAAGYQMGGQNNLSNPDAVLRIHKNYAASGADLLITNTLTMNRIYIESDGAAIDVREVNLAGAQLARQAVSDGKYVLGDIGSTGKILQPFGPLTQEEASRVYQEQASILVEGGVDGFIIETMFDLQEALCALHACRLVSDLPVIVSMAFRSAKDGGHTIMGNSGPDCARSLTDAGASVVGANCGDIDPLQMAEIVSAMVAATLLPIIAQPNAGKPKQVVGQTVFDMSPADFVTGIQACLEAGARLVGGCCGTTPAHIQAVSVLLEKS